MEYINLLNRKLDATTELNLYRIESTQESQVKVESDQIVIFGSQDIDVLKKKKETKTYLENIDNQIQKLSYLELISNAAFDTIPLTLYTLTTVKKSHKILGDQITVIIDNFQRVSECKYSVRLRIVHI